MQDVIVSYLVVGAAIFLAVRFGRVGRRDRPGVWVTLLLIDILMGLLFWLPFVVWSAYSTSRAETWQKNRLK